MAIEKKTKIKEKENSGDAKRQSFAARLSGASSSSSSGSNSGNIEESIGAIEASLRHHQQLQLNHCGKQASSLGCFFNALARKKPLDCRTETNLNRCLNLLDLTALGVGSTLGLGLYVLAGQVASNKAGPAVVVSFALAALASAFSALCYAEFAGLVPRAGSAYAYSYITVGEFVAFIIGWNLILEYVIGASSVARGFSGYLRFVCEHVMQSFGQNNPPIPDQLNALNSTSILTTAPIDSGNLFVPINASGSLVATIDAQKSFGEAVFAYVYEYFDWPSIVIIIAVTMFILFGVKESTNTTLAFTTLNLLVVLAVVISSIGSLDIHNWQLSKSEIPKGYGEGGFFPYGWSGVLAGSATCFFGFIGFDTIASSAEEAKNPKKNVPLSIIVSLFISFLAYMAIAIVQTLIWPYYDQNNVTILPYIFDKLNMPITYWVVLLGAISGLASSQLGGMYPLPRILYSMAHDKLIYGWISHVNKRLKLPVRAAILGSIFVAILACLLDIQDLADMVSIGTLAAYSLVSLSVLILRYEDRSDAVNDSTNMSNHLSFTDILALQDSGANLTAEVLPAIPGIELATAAAHNRAASQNNKEDLRDKEKQQQQQSIYLQGAAEIRRPKLTAKGSTPIRESGSRAVVAQMSVGFNTWFKAQESDEKETAGADLSTSAASTKGTTNRRTNKGWLHLLISWKQEDQLGRNRAPDDESSSQSKILISIIVILTILLDVIALYLTCKPGQGSSEDPHMIISAISQQKLVDPDRLMLSTGSIVLVMLLAAMLMLSRLPVSQTVASDMFQVPLVPLIPTLSIFVNTFLMLNLSYLTWVRFTVWMTGGFFIYFSYGIWNSQGYILHL